MVTVEYPQRNVSTISALQTSKLVGSFLLGVGIMAPLLPNCPQCESRMLEGPRPFKRIFGDIRAFECLACDYILILTHPFQPLLFDQAIGLKLDAAE
jgi:hypothetical protein